MQRWVRILVHIKENHHTRIFLKSNRKKSVFISIDQFGASRAVAYPNYLRKQQAAAAKTILRSENYIYIWVMGKYDQTINISYILAPHTLFHAERDLCCFFGFYFHLLLLTYIYCCPLLANCTEDYHFCALLMMPNYRYLLDSFIFISSVVCLCMLCARSNRLSHGLSVFNLQFEESMMMMISFQIYRRRAFSISSSAYIIQIYIDSKKKVGTGPRTFFVSVFSQSIDVWSLNKKLKRNRWEEEPKKIENVHCGGGGGSVHQFQYYYDFFVKCRLSERANRKNLLHT